MSRLYRPLSAAAILLIGFQCHAADLVAAQEVQATDTLINPLPMGCRYPEVSIPDYVPPHRPLTQKPAPPPFNAMADKPVGPTRRVSFSYHFSGLQDIPPTYLPGSFKISSTVVTVFEGTSLNAAKASVATFRHRNGNADGSASLTKSSVEHRPFQDRWVIRVMSKGKWHDAAGPVRPATVTFLCDMPINDTASPTPTLTQ